MQHTIERYLETVDHLAPGSRALYRRVLTTWRVWLDDLPLAQIDLTSIRAYLKHLKEEHVPFGSDTSARPAQAGKRLSANAQASHYRTIKTFWRWCAREGLLSNTQEKIFDHLDAPRVEDAPRPAASPQLLRQLIAACGDASNEESARDIAMLRLLAESGMRVSDLCALCDERTELHKRRGQVKGKGSKWRWIYWRPAGAAALARYLMLRRGKRGHGPLFRGVSSRNPGGACTPNLVRSKLKRIAELADVALPPGAPLHSFRHFFARDAIARGADVSEVSQLLGHASIETTMRYLRHDPEKLQGAYNRIFGVGVSKPREGQRDAESHG